MENVLEIKNLTVSIRENRILKDISVSIERSKIIGMIGGSGSGKTTLIRTILNIQMPEDAKIEGEILIKGEIASAENRMYVQPVFQDPGSYFNPRWNLLQCLEEPLHILTSISKQEKLERIKPLMKEFSLSEKYLSQSIKRFSGGELQRISLIRAILCNPEVLLMDEPVSGLDPLIQKEALRLIRELNSQKKITIFLISHDIDFISKLCDFVYVIQNGEIVEKNFTSKILDNPQNEYTKLLLQSRNLAEVK
ncbi:MAG TPA: ATP-binding cassette domain-containing protein [Leptospiraceae bacterium]|nr:ATP-binding cassette domain-containing protein [Leptospiraceae bacterium]